MKKFCLLMGKFPQFLDHLAPFAITYDLPLVIIEKEIYDLAKTYYPQAKAELVTDVHFMTNLIPQSEVIISCITHKIVKGAFSFIKDFEHYFLPHGMSEKGELIPEYFAHFKGEKNIFVYGKYLKDMINKEAQLPSSAFTTLGNYRYEHYKKNQEHYDSFLKDEKKPFIFYAPTWDDNAKGSSIASAKQILKSLQEEGPVVCKWHPHLFWQHPHLLDEIEKLFPNILFLRNFPLIYPLIESCKLYVGDLSSIGYDCLACEKPMLFLKETQQDSKLFSCGTILEKKNYPHLSSYLKKALEDHPEKLKTIRSLYSYAFDSTMVKRKDLPFLKEELSNSI